MTQSSTKRTSLDAAAVPAADVAEANVRERIVLAARGQLFADGYSALTMDRLANGLGVSKKTLYVHFDGKDALVSAILAQFVAQVRETVDTIFNDPDLGFTVKLRRFGETMVKRFAQIPPHVLRDLQRSAPHLYRQLEEVRHNNIPYVFGQIIRQGQAAGMVRAEIAPAFAIEFWRPAIQSLMHPDALERLQATPEQVFRQAIDLFFGGLLTPAGRKDYEKNLTV